MWKCKQCGEIKQNNMERCSSCRRVRTAKLTHFSSAGMPTQRLSSAGVPTQRLDRQQQEQLACAKCQSPRVIPRVRVLDHTHANATTEASLEIQQNPHALLFKGGVTTALYAWVCGACGYTELYASHPRLLWEAHQAAEGNG